jgi:hypothetical protein
VLLASGKHHSASSSLAKTQSLINYATSAAFLVAGSFFSRERNQQPFDNNLPHGNKEEIDGSGEQYASDNRDYHLLSSKLSYY